MRYVEAVAERLIEIVGECYLYVCMYVCMYVCIKSHHITSHLRTPLHSIQTRRVPPSTSYRIRPDGQTPVRYNIGGEGRDQMCNTDLPTLGPLFTRELNLSIRKTIRAFPLGIDTSSQHSSPPRAKGKLEPEVKWNPSFIFHLFFICNGDHTRDYAWSGGGWCLRAWWFVRWGCWLVCINIVGNIDMARDDCRWEDGFRYRLGISYISYCFDCVSDPRYGYR